jgi:hypothetical protein
MESSVRPGLRLVDRLLLIGAWAISCSAVYGLGFYTGSQIQERVPDDEERIVRLPVTAEPPAAGQRTKAGEDFTFYDTLVQGPPRARQSDAVTADRSAEPAGPAKPETGKTHSASRDSTATGSKSTAKNATARTAVASAAHKTVPAGKTARGSSSLKASSPAPGTTTASRAKVGGTGTHAKPVSPRTRSASAAGDPAPGHAKRSPTAGAAPGGHPRSAPTATASRSTQEPAAHTQRPREGVARSTVAAE